MIETTPRNNCDNPPLMYVSGISWPRSGHHLLVRLLRGYFGEDFHYCEFYSTAIDCCRNYPCSRKKYITFSKNHDFELDLKIDKSVPVIVQHRAFLNSLVSDFELHILSEGASHDTTEQFKQFSLVKARDYIRFRQKWICDSSIENRILVSYEQLTENTAETLSRCLRVFQQGHQIDMHRLNVVIDSVDGESVKQGEIKEHKQSGIRITRDYKEHRHYDPELFSMLKLFTSF